MRRKDEPGPVNREADHTFSAVEESRFALQGEFLSSPDLSVSWVVRERLLAHLNKALQHPLTLLVAPPGYGKSLLVRDWLQHAKHPTVWMPLHPRDNDALAFWSRFEQLLNDTLPELRLRPSLARQEGPCAQGDTAEAIRERLASQLVRLGRGWQAPEHLIWVLDDLQNASAPDILQGLNQLLDLCPPRLHLIITSRTQPDLQLGKRRVAQQVLEFGPNQLKFDDQDCQTFLCQGLGLPLNREQCRYLQRKTEGWPAALQLAGRTLSRGQDIDSTLQQLVGHQGPLSDYLFEEIYTRQSPEIRSFLSHAAHLPWFTADLLDTLRQANDSAGILTQLRHSEALIQALEVPAGAFRLHDLFRDWLRQHPLTHTGAEAIRLQASDWFTRQGFRMTALDLLLDGEQWAAVDRLLAERLEQWLMQGLTPVLLARLRQIPPAAVHQFAWLRLAKGLNSFREGRFTQADQALESLTAELSSDAPLGLVALFGRSQIALYSGREQDTHKLLVAVEAHPAFPASPLGPWVRQALAVNRLYAGEVQAARQAFIACARECEQHGDLYGQAVSINWLVPCLLFSGDIPQAWRWIEHLEETLRAESASSPLHALIPYLRAGLLRESHQLDQADAALKQALDRGIDQLTPIDLTYHRLQSWNLAINQGRLDRARELVQDLRFDHEMSGRPWHTLYPEPELLEIIQALVEGQTAPIIHWSLNQEWETIRGGMLQSIATRLIWIRARLALQQDCEAELESLASWAEQQSVPYFQIRIGLVLAQDARMRQQDLCEARRQMVAVLGLSRRFGFTQVLLDEGPDLLPLLALCEGKPDCHNEVERLRQMLRKPDSSTEEPQPPKPTIQPEPRRGSARALPLESLSERENEILQLLGKGLSNRDLAEGLGIALPTVKTHLRNIYSKLGASSRTQALALARQRGLMI